MDSRFRGNDGNDGDDGANYITLSSVTGKSRTRLPVA
jgi:hypothetical protein